MENLHTSIKIVFLLILFFLSVLIYFLIFLLYSHFRTNIINSKKAKIKLILTSYLKGIEIEKPPLKKLSSIIGIEVISELLESITEEDKLKLKSYLNELDFNKHILKRLKSSNKNLLTFTIKMVGNLQLFGMEERIKNAIYDNKNSIDIQYIGFEVLSKLGCDDMLVQIFNDESLHVHLTYRSLLNILIVYSGDKISFYKKMLSVNDDYVVRITIKAIGNEKVYELVQDTQRYIASDNIDMKIAAISSLGILEDKQSYDLIRGLCKNEAWQVRSAALKAIAQIDLEGSVDSLMEGLRDKEWWVRYNSAAALVHCKDISKIHEEVSRSEDQFAKDILKSAIEKLNLKKGLVNAY